MPSNQAESNEMHQLYPSVSAVKQAPTHLPALIYIRDGRAYG